MSQDLYKFATILSFLFLFLKDWLGLKKMDQDGKLHFLTADGDHLQFSNEFFESKILPFLK